MADDPMRSTSSSSDGFIKPSLPYIGGQVQSMSAEKLMSAAIDSALTQGNASLRAQLEADEFWAPYADLISIEWDGSAFAYQLEGTPEQVHAIQMLEYGSPDVAPIPILRRHAFRLGSETSRAVEDRVRQVVGLG